MKVRVIVNNLSKGVVADTRTIEAIVTSADTAFSFQERVAEVTNTLCFPDQHLSFNGQVIPGSSRLFSSDIKEGDELEFSFQPSETSLVKQLSDLLGAKTMSPEELSLLYCYRHLVTLEDAIKALGHSNGKPSAFLNDQKCFSIQNGIVKLASAQQMQQPSTDVCPTQENHLRGTIEVKVSIVIHAAGKAQQSPALSQDEDSSDSLHFEVSETVAKAKKIIASALQVPFPNRDLLHQGKKLEDGVTLREAGVTNGASIVMVVHVSGASLASQLEELLSERTGLSPNELSLHYCQRFGTPVSQALRTLGVNGNLRRFLESQPLFAITGGCVTLVDGPKLCATTDMTKLRCIQEMQAC